MTKDKDSKFEVLKGGKDNIDMEALEKDLPKLRMFLTVQAKLFRANYEALVEAGFSKDEALQLCTKIFMPQGEIPNPIGRA